MQPPTPAYSTERTDKPGQPAEGPAEEFDGVIVRPQPVRLTPTDLTRVSHYIETSIAKLQQGKFVVCPELLSRLNEVLPQYLCEGHMVDPAAASQVLLKLVKIFRDCEKATYRTSSGTSVDVDGSSSGSINKANLQAIGLPE